MSACLRRWGRRLLGLLVLLPLAAAASDERPVDVCFDERDQSAFLHRDAAGAWQGAALELVQRSFAATGLVLRLHPMPWGRCLREVAEYGKRGQIEALFYASRSAERDRQFLVSEPLHRIHGGVWYATQRFAQPPALRRMEDLAGYRLCGMLHHNYGWLQPLGIRQIDQGAPSLQAALAKLSLGRCELVISSLEAVRGGERLGQLAADEQRAFLPWPGREPVSQHLMLARGSDRAAALLQRFNHALGQLRTAGTADAIYRRHLDAAPP